MLVLLALIFLAPLVYMLLTSIKTNVEARSVPPTLFPSEPTLEAFRTLFFTDEASPVLLWLANSLISATAHAVLVLVVCSLAGYALARMEFPLKNLIFGLIIATLFLPALHLHDAELRDPQPARLAGHPAGHHRPGRGQRLRGVLHAPVLQHDPDRAGGERPDRRGRTWRTFFSIVLPNARAALVTLAVISFLANWNDFVFPIYVLFSPERLTLPVGLTKLQGAYDIDYPVIMAGAAMASIPVLLLYIFVQRYVIEGVASSGIKG